ncbi:MAG TPA: TolC family protein [Ignavibacteriaceae bacterium]|nr:TolC family protein [Ignavibacteriaceae bacterium]
MSSNKIRIFLLVMLGISISLSGYAQDKKKMTVEESVKVGLENSNFLHSSKMNMKYAEAKSKEVNTFRLPSLTFGASYTRLSEVDPFSVSTPFGNFNISPAIFNNYNFKVTLRQPLFTGFNLESNSKMADLSYKASKEDFNSDKNELIYNIKNAYWGLFQANQIKKVTEENVAQIQAHLTDVKNLFDQGLATKNDMLKVQVQLGEAQLRLIDSKNAVKIANINLDNILGISLSTEIEPVNNIEKRSKDVSDLGNLLDKAYSVRPELKSMDYRVKASESGITAAKSDWWPQLYLTGNYYYSRPNQRILPTQDKFNGTWDVSVSMSFNLWNWGATSDRTDQAEAQFEQAKDGYKILKDRVTLEVTRNYLNINKSKERMTVSEQSVDQAEENYKVTDEKFKNGLALNSDLLDAEVALLQAKTNYIQSVVDYELALAQLKKSIGE